VHTVVVEDGKPATSSHLIQDFSVDLQGTFLNRGAVARLYVVDGLFLKCRLFGETVFIISSAYTIGS
jgi:hypothetical protein